MLAPAKGYKTGRTRGIEGQHRALYPSALQHIQAHSSHLQVTNMRGLLAIIFTVPLFVLAASGALIPSTSR